MRMSMHDGAYNFGCFIACARPDGMRGMAWAGHFVRCVAIAGVWWGPLKAYCVSEQIHVPWKCGGDGYKWRHKRWEMGASFSAMLFKNGGRGTPESQLNNLLE
ncbi:hypothetical protein SUGI_0004840 [Cryptomeria japonica]|nr:hypothetical protein SUGI_0004840 [Cryptomeria japonica]